MCFDPYYQWKFKHIIHPLIPQTFDEIVHQCIKYHGYKKRRLIQRRKNNLGRPDLNTRLAACNNTIGQP